jgi:hypothetical protein
MKGVPFRRANHAELKLPPLAKERGLGLGVRGAHLLARSGHFSSPSFSRSSDPRPYFLDIRALQGKIPAFHVVLLGQFWT